MASRKPAPCSTSSTGVLSVFGRRCKLPAAELLSHPFHRGLSGDTVARAAAPSSPPPHLRPTCTPREPPCSLKVYGILCIRHTFRERRRILLAIGSHRSAAHVTFTSVQLVDDTLCMCCISQPRANGSSLAQHCAQHTQRGLTPSTHTRARARPAVLEFRGRPEVPLCLPRLSARPIRLSYIPGEPKQTLQVKRTGCSFPLASSA